MMDPKGHALSAALSLSKHFRLGISHCRISAALLYFSLKCSYLLISAEAGCDDQASTTTTPAAAPAKEKKHRSRRVAVMSTGGGRPRKRGKSLTLTLTILMRNCVLSSTIIVRATF